MGVDVQEGRPPELADPGQGASGHDQPVPDAADLEEHFAHVVAPGRSIEHDATQGPDHDLTAAAATAARSPAPVRWQMARARASAVSAGFGGAARCRRLCTMRWTWALVAPP